jgi:hypothetical protein
MLITDLIHDILKDTDYYKNLSMDAQGEICVKIAEGLDKVIKIEPRKPLCGDAVLHNYTIDNGGYCPRCREMVDEQNLEHL